MINFYGSMYQNHFSTEQPDPKGMWAKREDVEDLLATLQLIRDWCDAYPLEVFPEPDMADVRRKLGDSDLSRLSAHNFRHVLNGIKRIIDEVEATRQIGERGADSQSATE
jgi:hypothetical protein